MPADDAERLDPASLREGIVLPLPGRAPIPAVVLRGAIDRVDVVEGRGTRFGVAIDYKSGKAKSYGDAFADLADFQLPIYCEAMRGAGVEPVGAVFLGISSGERFGVIREDFADRFLLGPAKGVRRLRAETFERRLAVAMEALAGWAAKAATPEVVVAPRDDDCGWCELAPVCRIATFGVGGGGRDDA
jgi:RecB family exonuclease